MTVTMTGTQTTPEGGDEGLPSELGRFSHIWRVLRRDRTAMLGVVLVLTLGAAAVLAPLIAPHDPNAVDVAKKYRPPSGEFLLGSDNLGRDILSRLLFGARLSIGTAVVAGLAIGVLGLVMGMLAGWFGGVVDAVISRVVDILLAFPLSCSPSGSPASSAPACAT